MLVLIGSLWTYSIPSKHRADGVDGYYERFLLEASSTDDVVTVRSADDVNVMLHCPKKQLSPLKKERYNLLLAVTTCEDRLNVFNDAERLCEAEQLVVDSNVYYQKLGASQIGYKCEQIPATVRYRGELPDSAGTWFGIEFEDVSRILPT